MTTITRTFNHEVVRHRTLSHNQWRKNVQNPSVFDAIGEKFLAKHILVTWGLWRRLKTPYPNRAVRAFHKHSIDKDFQTFLRSLKDAVR